MGFGHRVYRAEDPRARVLRRTARELGAPRFEVAEALERAADAVLQDFGAGPLIFNLGHGVLPDTPVAHVARLVARVRGVPGAP
jgi:hypothetical protein